MLHSILRSEHTKKMEVFRLKKDSIYIIVQKTKQAESKICQLFFQSFFISQNLEIRSALLFVLILFYSWWQSHLPLRAPNTNQRFVRTRCTNLLRVRAKDLYDVCYKSSICIRHQFVKRVPFGEQKQQICNKARKQNEKRRKICFKRFYFV